jgi:hypothetical protein
VYQDLRGHMPSWPTRPAVENHSVSGGRTEEEDSDVRPRITQGEAQGTGKTGAVQLVPRDVSAPGLHSGPPPYGSIHLPPPPDRLHQCALPAMQGPLLSELSSPSFGKLSISLVFFLRFPGRKVGGGACSQNIFRGIVFASVIVCISSFLIFNYCQTTTIQPDVQLPP